MRCTACGRDGLRSTTTVQIPDGAGSLRGARVCSACAKDAITILPARPASRCSCGKPPTTCGSCVDAARVAAAAGKADLSTLAKQLRVRADAYEKRSLEQADESDEGAGRYSSGLAAGLTQAADLIACGRW